MKVRTIEEKDLPAAAELYLLAYNVEWSNECAENYIRRFMNIEKESCLLVEENDGQISGVALAYSYLKPAGLVLFLQEIFVNPKFRNKGYGRKLIEQLRGAFEQNPRIRVTPQVKADTGILNFYNSLGFEKDQMVTYFDD